MSQNETVMLGIFVTFLVGAVCGFCLWWLVKWLSK